MNVKKLFDLSGKTALITGGSRGLGLQIAEALVEMGAKVAITARKAGELAEAKAHLKDLGVEALTVVNDLQDTASVKPMVEQVLKSHGQIDILVNNAGAAWGAPAEDHPLEAWYKVINLNLTAVFLVSLTCGLLLVATVYFAFSRPGRRTLRRRVSQFVTAPTDGPPSTELVASQPVFADFGRACECRTRSADSDSSPERRGNVQPRRRSVALSRRRSRLQRPQDSV